MQPGIYDFPPLTRGDTEVLGVILHDQDSFTQQISPGIRAGDLVEWIVSVPSGSDLVKTTSTDGGLYLDLPDSRVAWAVAAADWAALTGKGPFLYRIRVTSADGAVRTYLKGTLRVED